MDKKLAIISLLLVALNVPSFVLAATLFLNPEIGEHSVGDTFTAEVRVDTEGDIINTIEADLVFPSDLLEIVGLEKENSILNLWIGDPVYLNEEGLISFVGGLPAPGYQGKDGLIGTITFKAKSEGKAEVSFQENSSKVFVNDGFGTEALLKTKGATYNLISIKKKLFYGLLALLLIIFLIIIVWGIRRLFTRDKR